MTVLFQRNRTRHLTPLAIAAGGGGLGLGRFIDTGSQHGQAINMSRPPITGEMYGARYIGISNGVNMDLIFFIRSAGAGGGWTILQGQVSLEHMGLMGLPLVQGALGGQACYESTDARGDGGFGGGGGGCIAGGDGGGYSGGTNRTNGEGGYSFFNSNRTIPTFSTSWSGYHTGPGSVIVIPAIRGCGCKYRCLALNARRSQVACICPKDWKLDVDGKSCIRKHYLRFKFCKTYSSVLVLEPADTYPDWVVVLLFFMFLSVVIAFGFVCFMLYTRYQHRSVGMLRRKMLTGPDLQLSRLRVQPESGMTEYNPNYEFGGSICSVKDLKGIPRNQLQLQK